ncbi:MAG: NRDE family protein [Gemmatimonadales bacterium]
MCLVLTALDFHPEYSVIVAANRDEFYDRPTAPAEFWADAPSVLGGRDLQAGGTWLGIDRGGRLAAVTNYRQGQRESSAPRSRGRLVSDFLTSEIGPLEHMERIRSEAGLYNGFNLIAGDAGGLFYYSNREGRVRSLAPGVYGLSNHLLDTPWPKVATTKSAFDTLLNGGASELTADLFALLSDRNRPADALLPSTGVGPQWERLLSSAFIASDNYGTRSSTVVMVGRDGRIVFVERAFGPGGAPGGEARFETRVP